MNRTLPRLIKQLIRVCVCVLIIVVYGCQSRQSQKSGGLDFPRDKTLYIGGFQWGEPNSFNPLCDIAAFPVMGNVNLMYEPLLAYNPLNGEMEPLLARSCRITTEAVHVILDPRALWSDGERLTASDVKFTYETGQRFKNSISAAAWDYIEKITVDTIPDSTQSGTVEQLSFFIDKTRKNPLKVLDFLQGIHIVPRHILEPVLIQSNNDFSLFLKNSIDKSPVVSGPYNLQSYSSEKIILKRRDDYWGNAARFQNRLPKPQFIIHPIYKSNDHYSIALQQGNLDVSQTFIPRIWLKEKRGVHAWYSTVPYFLPGSIPMLIVNTTRHPLSDKNLRRAMAAAINYNDIRELAVSGYSPPLKPGLITPFGIEEPFYSDEEAQKSGLSYDPEKAKQILRDAGYTSSFDAKGTLIEMKDPAGKKVPTMSIKSPTGWTDWEIMVRIAVKGMRTAGIDVREGFLDAGVYTQNGPVGDFDLMMARPGGDASPSKPWARFEAVMSAQNWKPIGEKMNENQGRYNNPTGTDYNPVVDSLIKAIPSLTGSDLQKAYRALNVIFMQDLPAIPLVYRPDMFYEFSIKHWTGFPTALNPYAPPQDLCVGASTRALWEIEPVAK